MEKIRTVSIPTRLWGKRSVKTYGLLEREIVICVPGFQATGDHPTITAVADYFCRQGLGVVTFSFPNGIAVNIRKQVMFIMDVVYFCRKKYPQAQINLLGGSLGALSSAIAVTEDNAVHRLITLNGYFGSFFLRGESIRVYALLKIRGIWNHELRDDLWRYIKNNFRPDKISVPTLVIHAIQDRVAYPIQSKLLFRRLAGKKQLFLYTSDTADHELRNKNDIEKVAAAVVSFLGDLRER